ncbi:unnamed protein product [Closterium sp. Yama58-4]|nr:unnamed protein product [Closterium sp. Yama58-4]
MARLSRRLAIALLVLLGAAAELPANAAQPFCSCGGYYFSCPPCNEMNAMVMAQFVPCGLLDYFDGSGAFSPSYCSIGGVSCDRNGFITTLDLGNRSLTGCSIPNSITKLTELTKLELWGNQLAGSIPSGISQLKRLQYLGLAYNQLTGSIPSELSRLPNLRTLNLKGNQLSGPLPAFLGSFFHSNVNIDWDSFVCPPNKGTCEVRQWKNSPFCTKCGGFCSTCTPSYMSSAGGFNSVEDMDQGEVAAIVVASVVFVPLLLLIVYLTYIRAKEQREKERREKESKEEGEAERMEGGGSEGEREEGGEAKAAAVESARKAIYNADADQINLKQWVAPLVAAGDAGALKDPQLEAPDDLVLRMARLALRCTAMPTASRPSISRVLGELLVMKEEFLGKDEDRMAHPRPANAQFYDYNSNCLCPDDGSPWLASYDCYCNTTAYDATQAKVMAEFARCSESESLKPSYCSVRGVDCDDRGMVNALDLGSRFLVGCSIPYSISKLTALSKLYDSLTPPPPPLVPHTTTTTPCPSHHHHHPLSLTPPPPPLVPHTTTTTPCPSHHHHHPLSLTPPPPPLVPHTTTTTPCPSHHHHHPLSLTPPPPPLVPHTTTTTPCPSHHHHHPLSLTPPPPPLVPHTTTTTPCPSHHHHHPLSLTPPPPPLVPHTTTTTPCPSHHHHHPLSLTPPPPPLVPHTTTTTPCPSHHHHHPLSLTPPPPPLVPHTTTTTPCPSHHHHHPLSLTPPPPPLVPHTTTTTPCPSHHHHHPLSLTPPPPLPAAHLHKCLWGCLHLFYLSDACCCCSAMAGPWRTTSSWGLYRILSPPSPR